MPRRVKQPFSVKRVEAKRDPGMHCDGNGLYLRVSGAYGKSWICRTVVQGKRRDFGLGSASLVTLKEAREAAHQIRRAARQGGDPSSLGQQSSLSFGEAAQRAFDAHKAKWTSDKHGEIWWSSIKRFVLPTLADRPLDSITAKDIHDVLEPIWVTKYDTARKVKQRISLVFDWAKGSGHYFSENPVNGVTKALPAVRRNVRHHAALSWKELPDLMLRLKMRDGLSARLTEFTILTCLRSNEVRGMKWNEVHGDTWTVPAERMKSRIEHRVPLAPQCQLLLEQLPRSDTEIVFPSPNGTRDGRSKPMSDVAHSKLMKRMGVEGITLHGFRSTFKDWCTENMIGEWEASEMALAHTVGNAVERAYARSDLFDQRIILMQQWADFALSKSQNRRKKRQIPNHLKGLEGAGKAKKIKIRRHAK